MMLCIMNTCCYLLASIIMLDIPQQITLHLENVQRTGKNQRLDFVFRM